MESKCMFVAGAGFTISLTSAVNLVQLIAGLISIVFGAVGLYSWAMKRFGKRPGKRTRKRSRGR